MEQIDYQDLFFAYEDCKKHKSTTFTSEEYELNALFNLELHRRELNNGSFVPGALSCFVVKDPTVREIWASPFRCRINHHFMMKELKGALEKNISPVCYNCRDGLGTDRAIKKLVRILKQESNNYKDMDNVYYIKGDLTAFFMSVDKVLLNKMVNSIIEKDYKGRYPELLKWLFNLYLIRNVTENCIKLGDTDLWSLLPKHKSLFAQRPLFGMEIGTLLAQNLCNVYLYNALDKFVTDCGFKMVRYVDDWIIVCKNGKHKLEILLEQIKQNLKEYGLGVNEKKTKIRNAKYGIDFLGKKIFFGNVVLHKNTKNRIYQKSFTFRTAKDAYISTAGRRGTFLYYGAKRFAQVWYNSLPKRIRNFFRLNSDMTCVLI